MIKMLEQLMKAGENGKRCVSLLAWASVWVDLSKSASSIVAAAAVAFTSIGCWEFLSKPFTLDLLIWSAGDNIVPSNRFINTNFSIVYNWNCTQLLSSEQCSAVQQLWRERENSFIVRTLFIRIPSFTNIHFVCNGTFAWFPFIVFN